MGSHSIARAAGRCVGLVGLTILLSACDPTDRARAPDALDAVRNIDLQPRFPRPTEEAAARQPPPQSMTFFGRDDAAERVATPSTLPIREAENGEGYELNFENAPITTVSKVILGDILGAGYTIDSRIQGTVTLASGRPIAKGDLVFALENALRASNVVLVPDHTGYRLIPSGEAIGSGRVNVAAAVEPGYGVSIVPLRNVSAQTILKLLDGLSLKAGAARAEPARNLVVVQGSGPERRTAVEAILSFDVDWMRGQSVGVYPLRNGSPEAVITELEKIMEAGDGGLNQPLIKFQPIVRLNAVLVVSRRTNLLKTAATWVARLDRPNTTAGVQIYRLRYGDAARMARLLNDLFGSGRSSTTANANTLDSGANQIAPGAGLATTSSGLQTASNFDQPVRQSGSAPTVSAAPGLGSSGGFGSSGTLDTAGGFGTPGRSAFETSLGANRGLRSGTGAAGGDNLGASVAIPGVRITADTANNSLLIFASPENYRLIEQTLQKLDRPQLQVAINATIAEITLNNDLRYGVQYFIKSNNIGLGNDKGSAVLNSSALSTAASAALNRVLPGFNFLVGAESDPRVILDALRNITDVKVLSTPSVVVMDNQVAILQVGDQVPIATQTATNLTNPNTPIVNSIDYRNTGVILRVLPRINANGNVVLDIEQEISNVSDTATANTLTPTVSQRRVKSSIAVASGQSVLLGGLISERQDRGRQGIPILEEIPGIGDAFSHNTRTLHRTELMIFIQPQIIRDSVDAYQIAEELRTKLKGSAEAAFPPGPSLRGDPLVVR